MMMGARLVRGLLQQTKSGGTRPGGQSNAAAGAGGGHRTGGCDWQRLGAQGRGQHLGGHFLTGWAVRHLGGQARGPHSAGGRQGGHRGIPMQAQAPLAHGDFGLRTFGGQHDFRQPNSMSIFVSDNVSGIFETVIIPGS